MNKTLLKTGLVLAMAGLMGVAGCDDEDTITPTDGGRADAGVTRTDGAAGTGAGGTGGTPGVSDGGVDATPVATARGAANPPMLGGQIDRMGRAAISTATVGTFTADATAKGARKDAYNQADMANWPTFVPDIRVSLAVLDALDGTCGNQLAADAMPASRYTFLATVLADDRLYVNSGSAKCGIYLGIEAEIVNPALPAELKGSCGGRTPTDDVIERSYSVLAAGILAGVDDTIAKDPDFATYDLATFPFLSAPK